MCIRDRNPNKVEPYYLLSRIKYSNENKTWQDLIFSENILINKSKKEQISIYFTRANILHKEKNYKESSKNLRLANTLKHCLHSSNANLLINKSKKLLIQSGKEKMERC